MSEVKNIPRLRFPSFNEEWKTNSIGDIAKVIRGASPRPKGDPRFYGGNVPRLMGTDVTRDGKYVTPTTDFLTQEGSKKSRFLPKGTLTMTCSGNVGIPSFLNIDACIHDGFLAFVDKSDKILDDYLFYSLFVLKNKLERGATHGGVFTNLTTDIVRNYNLTIPSLPEQQKIADFLTAVDKRIELLEKKKTLLETYKKGVMKKIFNQEIRFKDENGNDFPDWEEKRLGGVCNIQKGKQLNKSELTDYGQFPAINGGVEPSGYTDEWNTVANTITISEGGNSCGYVNFIKTNFWCGGHCYSLLDIQNYLLKDYLYEYLKFKEQSIMNLRVGSGLPNIQKRDIDGFPILIPSLEEQKTLSHFLSTLGIQIELLETQIDKSKIWKKGLLQKMFV